MSDNRQPAPDYTNAALITLGVNLFLGFYALWSLAGYPAVLLMALGLNYGIDRLSARRDPKRALERR